MERRLHHIVIRTLLEAGVGRGLWQRLTPVAELHSVDAGYRTNAHAMLMIPTAKMLKLLDMPVGVFRKVDWEGATRILQLVERAAFERAPPHTCLAFIVEAAKHVCGHRNPAQVGAVMSGRAEGRRRGESTAGRRSREESGWREHSAARQAVRLAEDGDRGGAGAGAGGGAHAGGGGGGGGDEEPQALVNPFFRVALARQVMVAGGGGARVADSRVRRACVVLSPLSPTRPPFTLPAARALSCFHQRSAHASTSTTITAIGTTTLVCLRSFSPDCRQVQGA
jgi:hypothetical protein